MGDLYSELKKKNGNTCYTLSQNKPAKMNVDDWKVTITYPTGRSLELPRSMAVSYTHLRAHETVLDLVCRLLLEKKK